MNNLLQPDIQDVSNKMCANCDALICVGCPVFEMDKHAADLARIMELLKSYEWIIDGRCPECHEDITDGHAKDCKLDAVLKSS